MEKQQTTRVLDMTEGSPAKLLVAFALPMFLGNLLQQFYNLADTAIAGHTYTGTSAFRGTFLYYCDSFWNPAYYGL